MGLIGLSLVISAILLGARAESLHHETVMKQVKKQALVFLYSVEREMNNPSIIGDIQANELILDRAYSYNNEILDFAVIQLRIYDRLANTIAQFPNLDKKSDVMGHSMNSEASGNREHNVPEIFSGIHKYLGGAVSHHWDKKRGQNRSETIITIPLTLGGEQNLALEAILDLDATMAIIESNDNDFEGNLVLIIVTFSMAALLAIWGVIHKGLLKPVQNLCHVTSAITKGDLSKRARCHGRDEIGMLGQSVNNMAGSIAQLLKDEEAAYLQTVKSLMEALEAKDLYTRQHSARVAKFSSMLGSRLNLSKDKRELLKKGALLHDLGKISIPDNILNKPNTLSEEEFETMKTHPVKTAAIMRPLKRFNEFTEIAAWHHERWDGDGYPDGLKGEEIPLLARIVSIADTWDAMTGDRVYRKGMPTKKALSIFEKELDSGQWDPKLVKEFVYMIKEN
jgi:putative nucleotidyltransferase with HDIG domain